jgi:hypothetical protein
MVRLLLQSDHFCLCWLIVKNARRGSAFSRCWWSAKEFALYYLFVRAETPTTAKNTLYSKTIPCLSSVPIYATIAARNGQQWMFRA